MCCSYAKTAAFLAIFAAVAGGVYVLEQRAVVEAAGTQAPRFEVDPMWPKPLPNHWIMGATIGVGVDAKDNVWVIHRGGSLEEKERYATWTPKASECCVPAPPVLAFSPAGDLIANWGGSDGPGYEWPSSNHGIDVDHKGNVWIGGNGRGKLPAALAHDESKMAAAGAVHDSMLLKFTQTGKFLMNIGKPFESKGSNDVANLRLPAKSIVDPKTNELYVADGYGNRRVIVFDADTGAYKRHWGAYGKKPEDTPLPPRAQIIQGPPPALFNNPVHAVVVSNDDVVYVADRGNNRLQVFALDGTFVREVFIKRDTLQNEGTVHDFAFSPDKEQRFLYVVDGSNKWVRILNRKTLEIVDSVGGRAGHGAQEFFHIHSMAVDSKGNIYLGEVNQGQRYMKYAFKGMGAPSAP